MNNGEPVEFELNSTDASTAAALVLRSAGGGARTLATDERLIIESLNSHITTATAFIFRDDDSGGTLGAHELMVPLGTGVTNVAFTGKEEGISGAKGLMPKVKASGAGQIYIAGVGRVVKG